MYIQWIGIFATILAGRIVVAQLDEFMPRMGTSDFSNHNGPQRDWFQEKCIKMGHPEAYRKLVDEATKMQSCVTSLVNFTAVQEELNEAVQSGRNKMEVYSRYCRNVPDLKNCIKGYLSSLSPCLNNDEKKDVHILQDMYFSGLDYICNNGGSNIHMFVEDGGPECFYDKRNNIQSCFKTVITNYQSQITESDSHSLTLQTDKEDCRYLRDGQICAVNALKTCKKPTAAKLIDGLLKTVIDKSPCSGNINGGLTLLLVLSLLVISLSRLAY